MVCLGDIEDFPGLDSVPCYNVHVEGGNVHVKARKADLVQRRVRGMARRDQNNKKTVIVVGGGMFLTFVPRRVNSHQCGERIAYFNKSEKRERIARL